MTLIGGVPHQGAVGGFAVRWRVGPTVPAPVLYEQVGRVRRRGTEQSFQLPLNLRGDVAVVVCGPGEPEQCGGGYLGTGHVGDLLEGSPVGEGGPGPGLLTS